MSANVPERRKASAVARGVHICALVLSSACVVPPPLGLDQPDAGANSAPVFLSVRGPDGKELAEPGPVTVIAHQDATASMTIYDADRTDTLTVQLFVDYTLQNPTSPRGTCTAPPPTDSSLERTVQCPLKAVCLDNDVANGNPHYFVFEVYDRDVTNDPVMFRSVASPGLIDHRWFLLTCLAPTQ